MRIVITGSSSGIGRALALRLMGHGHQVWGLARSDQSALVSELPGKFLASRTDVSSWNQVEAAATAITQHFGKVDALVACAGTQGTIGRATELDPEAWSAAVRANLDGTFFPIRALWPLMVPAERRAKIICFSGGGSTKARHRFSAYGVAKTGVVRLVETLAAEELDEAVDINAIAPGAIYTAMTEETIRLGPEVVGAEEFATAMKLRAAPTHTLERALDLCEWLLSPNSDGVSGRLISAPWDPWSTLDQHKGRLASSDIYQLRRIVPDERGESWS